MNISDLKNGDVFYPEGHPEYVYLVGSTDSFGETYTYIFGSAIPVPLEHTYLVTGSCNFVVVHNVGDGEAAANAA